VPQEYFELVGRRHTFSNVLSVVPLCSKNTAALTFLFLFFFLYVCSAVGIAAVWRGIVARIFSVSPATDLRELLLVNAGDGAQILKSQYILAL
jgi:hypothetical protein